MSATEREFFSYNTACWTLYIEFRGLLPGLIDSGVPVEVWRTAVRVRISGGASRGQLGSILGTVWWHVVIAHPGNSSAALVLQSPRPVFHVGQFAQCFGTGQVSPQLPSPMDVRVWHGLS